MTSAQSRSVFPTGHTSSYHSLQTGVQKTSPRFGVGFQANYTFSKSLDDASAIVGQLQGLNNGTRQSAAAQDPYSTRSEKGPSTFDVRHVVTASVVARCPYRSTAGCRRGDGFTLSPRDGMPLE